MPSVKLSGAVLLLLLLSPSVLAADEPAPKEYPFRFGFRQELVYNRTLGRKGESFVTADFRFPSGMTFLSGYVVENGSGRLSGYHLAVSSPVFLRWFGAEAHLIDRVFPEYGRGYLGYLLLFRYQARMPGWRDTRPSVRLAGRFGAHFHFQRSAENHLFNPLPFGSEYNNLTWVYDLGVILCIPLPGAVDGLDLTLGARNFTRQEAGFIADFTTYLRCDLKAGRIGFFFEGGQSPAGNFFLSGTWHTFYAAMGVTACF